MSESPLTLINVVGQIRQNTQGLEGFVAACIRWITLSDRGS